jgi:hypothetical protein
LRFLLFGKHPEQTRRVGSFHELRVVKERPSVRLGGLLLAPLYRILFAIAKLRAVARSVCSKYSLPPPILNKPERAGLSKGRSRRPPRIYLAGMRFVRSRGYKLYIECQQIDQSWKTLIPRMGTPVWIFLNEAEIYLLLTTLFFKELLS